MIALTVRQSLFASELRDQIVGALEAKGQPIPDEHERNSWALAEQLSDEEGIVEVFAKHGIPGSRAHIVHANLLRLSKIKGTTEQAIPAQAEPEHDRFAGAERR